MSAGWIHSQWRLVERTRRHPTVPICLSHTHFSVEYITLFHCAKVEYQLDAAHRKILPKPGKESSSGLCTESMKDIFFEQSKF